MSSKVAKRLRRAAEDASVGVPKRMGRHKRRGNIEHAPGTQRYIYQQLKKEHKR